MKEPSFLEMMGLTDRGISPHKDSLTLYDYEELEFYEARYRHMRPLLDEKRAARIAKIIHFIWVGPNPFPEASCANIRSWQQFHPGWQFYFWTDSASRECPVEGMTKRLVQEFDCGPLQAYVDKTPHPAEKSDLMRYAILYEMGGFYADHDATCLRSFEPLSSFDLVAGFEYPHWHGGLDSAVVFANGLIGASAQNPVFTDAMAHTIRLWHELDERFPDGQEGAERWKIIRRSFDSFTLAIKEIKADPARSWLLLPTSYFFPDIILDEETISAFQARGVVWARHGYTRLW